MKKLFAILSFVLLTSSAFSQQLCQASFYSNYNPVGNTLNLYDNSYNFDSTQLNVTSWLWTIQYGGASYTYTTQNPTIQLNGYNGVIIACLNISSSGLIPCQSSYCDSIYVGTVPVDTCIANFTYQYDPLNNEINLYDASQTLTGTINVWSWVVIQNGVTIFTSNLQNSVMPSSPNNAYYVCLTMSTDAGCSANYCNTVYTQDSINPACQLNVTASINHVSVINGNDGSIDLTVTGGTAPYTFVWSTGANTEDISNLGSGVYTVAITSGTCPSYTYTYQILEPFDSSNIIVDTLYSPIIDTCLNFPVDSSYIGSITVQGNNVTVEWILVGGGMTQTLFVTYVYTNLGTQVVVLSLNCNGAKSLSTYYSYIYISQVYSVAENAANVLLKLYPNPAKDFLNITLTDQTDKYLSINIINNSGQIVYSKSIASNASQLGINISELPSGVYFVQIYSSNGKPLVKKFVK